MITIDDLEPEMQKLFKDMIDDIILLSEFDEELRDGFKIMGDESFRRNISIYDLILEAYEKSEVEKSVKKWLKDRK